MKRDMDLVRDLMFEIEKFESDNEPKQLQLDSFEEDIINYHLRLLNEAGYIDAMIIQSMEEDTVLPKRLTWKGHEFLDAARDATNWQKAKAAMQQAGGSSMSVLKPILIKIIADRANEILPHLPSLH